MDIPFLQELKLFLILYFCYEKNLSFCVGAL